MSYLLKYKLLQSYYLNSNSEPIIPEFDVNDRNNYFKFKFSLDGLKEDLEYAKSDIAYNISTAYDIVIETGRTNLENYYYSFGTDSNNARKWEKFNGTLCIHLGSFADNEDTIIWFIGNGSEYINFNVIGSAATGLLQAFNTSNLPSNLIKRKDGLPAQEDIAISGHLGSLYYGVDIGKYNSYYESDKVTFKNAKIGNVEGFTTNYHLTKKLFAYTGESSNLYKYSVPNNINSLIDKLSIGTLRYDANGNDIGYAKEYGEMLSGLTTNYAFITNRYYAHYIGTLEEYYQKMVNIQYNIGTEVTLETPKDFYSDIYSGCKIKNGIYLYINTYLPEYGYKNIRDTHTISKPVYFALAYKNNESAGNGYRDDYINGNWNNVIYYINNTGLQSIIDNVNESHSTSSTTPKQLFLSGDLPSLPAKEETHYDTYLNYYNKLFDTININSKLNDWEIYIHNKIWKAGSVTLYFIEDHEAQYISYQTNKPTKIHRITVDKVINDSNGTRNSKIKDLLGKIHIKTSKYSKDFNLSNNSYDYIPYLSGKASTTYDNSDNTKPELPIITFVNNDYSIINYDNGTSNAYDNKRTSFIYRKKIFTDSSTGNYTKNVLVNPETELYDGMILYIYTTGDIYLYNSNYGDNNREYDNYLQLSKSLGYYYDASSNYNIKSNYDDDKNWLIFKTCSYSDYVYSLN